MADGTVPEPLFRIVLILSSIITVALLVYINRIQNRYNVLKDRFSKVISLENEIEKIKTKKRKIRHSIYELQNEYRSKKEVFNSLVDEIAIYDDQLDMANLGFYQPHFSFDTPEEYKEAIFQARAKQKQLVKSKEAIVCPTKWTVDGSAAKGRTMTNRNIKLAARAFNNECEAAVSNVTWRNIGTLELRITKAFEAINKLNESNGIFITIKYLNLKIEELRLAHEYQEKKHQEKEEKAEIKRQMREDAKLEKEIAKAIKEEQKYQDLYRKAKESAEKATGNKLIKLTSKIDDLEAKLKEAKIKSERAKSMAQQTKAGFIYVISNIGSFGDDIFKIGMTRRLEPFDRVRELSGASVPFIFDVHAMIYSDDAPALEKKLHHAFASKRVNLINNRKEFFRVPLDDIEAEVLNFSEDAKFIKVPEAKDYHQSKAILVQNDKSSTREDVRSKFPEAI